MNNLLFELTGVYANRGEAREVLRNVSLTLREGERVGLTGANGAGKSTLLELMIGLLQPTAGEVWAFGASRRAEPDFIEVRRRAGLLFEDPDDQLFHITVAEEVAFGPFNLGWSRDRVRAVAGATLERLGLAGYEERITFRLSHGEKRLVCLASILAMDPQVLLLDEPTAGLDEEHIARLVAALKESGKTLLCVSHDRPFLDAVTDQIWRLQGGQLWP